MSASDALGEQVWDALVSDGIKPYHCTGDGFDVVKHRDDTSHVVVVMRCEGALYGSPKAVFAQSLAAWVPALQDAELLAEYCEYDGRPLGVVVALDEVALRRGVTLACEAAALTLAERREEAAEAAS